MTFFYSKKYQSYQKKLLVSTVDKKELTKARDAGVFYTTLLDRREKLKSDRWCK